MFQAERKTSHEGIEVGVCQKDHVKTEMHFRLSLPKSLNVKAADKALQDHSPDSSSPRLLFWHFALFTGVAWDFLWFLQHEELSLPWNTSSSLCS